MKNVTFQTAIGVDQLLICVSVFFFLLLLMIIFLFCM